MATATDTSAKTPSVMAKRLTLREVEIIKLVVKGMTNTEIAKDRDVSSETVKSELKRIFRKIGVSNRVQAAVLAVRGGGF